MLPGPLADFITLGRAHRQLAVALKSWFNEQGLATYPARLFGLPSTVLGTLFSGPIAPTLMTGWNCLRIGRQREAAAWLVNGALSLAGCWLFYDWSHHRLLEMSAGTTADMARFLAASADPATTINPVLAVAFYFIGSHFRPRPVKEHFARGGAAVPSWISLLVIVVAFLAFHLLMPSLSVDYSARQS